MKGLTGFKFKMILLAALFFVAPVVTANAQEEFAAYRWSCIDPISIQQLNDAIDNTYLLYKFIKDGTCIEYPKITGGMVKRTVKTYVHRDQSTSSILEVDGPGDRRHFIVIEDKGNI